MPRSFARYRLLSTERLSVVALVAAFVLQGLVTAGHFHDLRDTGFGTVMSVTPANGIDGRHGAPVDDGSSTCWIFATIHAAGSFTLAPDIVPVVIARIVAAELVPEARECGGNRLLFNHRPRGPPAR